MSRVVVVWGRAQGNWRRILMIGAVKESLSFLGL